MFRFDQPAPRRRPDLTPMIDVVFLLLVFFMLVSRFSGETSLALTPAGGSGAGEWQGPPRVVEIWADGRVLLNGIEAATEDLAAALLPMMPTPDAPVVLRTRDADLQALAEVVEALAAQGITRVIVME
ncbi:ExbD/TolR family protein [Pseudothioclava arenosa]|uniref:Indolepyruvate ferredoxin oxidoreductase n=1 Tax=Pseudothioclava arenosa TaxID=1795308 RepID=A0A2A4CT67_9RHOB|nr:biopolymer transporter ExbD [Pseudothioclava arenosa]PCD77550.1 indolepyruvate ferredoxin oxidoreductase [Pseudothioclava arenosa]